MNAAVDMRRLEIQVELQTLRDQLQIAIDQRDYWSGKNPIEHQHWDGRVQHLQVELRIYQGQLRVLPGDGGPGEQRRLQYKEDWKRERDSYE